MSVKKEQTEEVKQTNWNQLSEQLSASKGKRIFQK